MSLDLMPLRMRRQEAWQVGTAYQIKGIVDRHPTMTTCQTTVKELLLLFRDALRALVPHMERARIAWRDGAAYDDWDAIAQVLYDKIVVASVRWSLPDGEFERCEFPDYNTSYPSYAGKTLILVSGGDEERLVFHSFTTEKEPFDRVRACRADGEGRVFFGGFVLFDADVAAYSVETAVGTVTDLTVDL